MRHGGFSKWGHRGTQDAPNGAGFWENASRRRWSRDRGLVTYDSRHWQALVIYIWDRRQPLSSPSKATQRSGQETFQGLKLHMDNGAKYRIRMERCSFFTGMESQVGEVNSRYGLFRQRDRPPVTCNTVTVCNWVIFGVLQWLSHGHGSLQRGRSLPVPECVTACKS